MANLSGKRRHGKQAKKQQTLDALLGKSSSPLPSRQKVPTPSSSAATRPAAASNVKFMPKGVARGAPPTAASDSEDDGGDDAEPAPPPVAPASPPRSSAKRKAVVLSDDDDEDEDDVPVATPARAPKPKVVVLDSDSDSDVRPSTAKRRRLARRQSTPSPPGSPGPSTKGRLRSTPTSRSLKSQRERRMELLRRRRNGEKVTELDQIDEASGDEEPHKALYDTDSDLPALDEFDDEDTDNNETSAEPRQTQSSPTKRKDKIEAPEGSDADSLDSFIDDEDGLIGAPDSVEIPLEFTSQAHKPMKALFRDIIDWLVQNRINPDFDRENAVSRLAWRKLDDEFRGLASSKFSSAAWNPEFHKSLRARPYMDNYESSRDTSDLFTTCQACNRTGHPATRVIRFSGKPYSQRTLDEIEQSEPDSEDEGPRRDRDENNNLIAGEGKDWLCGAVCASNAETAHDLLHWKHSLKDWVDERLRTQGLMSAKKVEKRERLSSKKRRKRADKIVDEWEEKGVVRALYDDFKRTLEMARVKSTSGKTKRRR
ncbi:hypothetical protein PspLS_02127 [Pyricularia sp. CBS 133598]|nr:hypothetical protein PspLS_02127 [Pyricularia sp. CBS 133598]